MSPCVFYVRLRLAQEIGGGFLHSQDDCNMQSITKVVELWQSPACFEKLMLLYVCIYTYIFTINKIYLPRQCLLVLTSDIDIEYTAHSISKSIVSCATVCSCVIPADVHNNPRVSSEHFFTIITIFLGPRNIGIRFTTCITK